MNCLNPFQEKQFLQNYRPHFKKKMHLAIDTQKCEALPLFKPNGVVNSYFKFVYGTRIILTVDIYKGDYSGGD